MEASDQNKIFLGGVSWETTPEALKEHFSKYGTVAGSVIAKDRITGSPRGFAFVSFTDSSAVDKALEEDTHNILGRTVEVKRAIPRGEQSQNQQQNRSLSRNGRSKGRSNDQYRTKKIFVGGLSPNLTEDEFRIYFEKFGKITDVVVMHDNVTLRPRGFGFITFDSEDAVEGVMQKSFHELSGKLVEVKRAVPKDENYAASNYYNARMGRGRGSNFDGYQNGNFPPYGPRYDHFQGYEPLLGYGGIGGYPYGAGIYNGGYPTGGYGGICYGMAPFAARSPWLGPAMIDVRGSPWPYSGAANAYSAYMNGVYVTGVTDNDYNGIVGLALNQKSSQLGISEQVMNDRSSAQMDSKNVEDSLSSC